MTVPRTIIVQPAWFKFTKTFSDFSAAKLTDSIELFTLEDGCLSHAVSVDLVTAFSGGSISAYSLSVGISGDATKYINAFNGMTGANTGEVQYATLTNETYKNERVIYIAATTVDDDLDKATAGEIDIYALLSKMV